jgi:replication factor A1
LNTFTQDWIIKVKLMKKYPMKTWNNAKGEGTLFTMDLMDRENTSIQATLFKEAATKWHPILQEGKIYTMTDG